jgi:hypothetical protein
MAIKMTRVKHSGKIDLKGWTLPALEEGCEELERLFYKGATEALECMLENSEDMYVYLPIEWGDSDGLGGPPQENPLTVYLRLPLQGEDDPEQPTWSFALNDLIDDFM